MTYDVAAAMLGKVETLRLRKLGSVQVVSEKFFCLF
jgi:hypothetical protein